MKFVHQGKTDEDTIVELADAFEAAFTPQAERRRNVAMDSREPRPDPF